MRQPGWMKWLRWSKPERAAAPGAARDRLAVLVAFVTALSLSAAFVMSKGKAFLMPGPMASVHGAIEDCASCHTKSGSSKLSWLHGLVAGDPLADSKACLTCHKMPDTALNAHGASADALKQSEERLTKIAARLPPPQSARAQSIAFPTDDVVARGLYCATCHQEHQGIDFGLNQISNEQCNSCHVAKFDSFEGHHPQFENYPFKRRTRIIFDHSGHFGKHFPEVAKKDGAKRTPATCSTCHNSRQDKRIMTVAPFHQTCAACHLDQIVGNERASGPKGIAFLSLPGLDLDSLRKRNAPIGEWPQSSEAVLTPFMKVLISRTERGRRSIEATESLNLLDLASATDDEMEAVTNLAWEIKGLFYGLIAGTASDVLGELDLGGGRANAEVVADLSAGIPRDVIIRAQQQWLPDLAAQVANRPHTGQLKEGGWGQAITDSSVAGSAQQEDPPRSEAPKDTNVSGEATAETGSHQSRYEDRAPDPSPDQAASRAGPKSADDEAAAVATVRRNPQACLMSIFGQCVLFKEEEVETTSAEDSKAKRTADKLPPPSRLGAQDVGNTRQQKVVTTETDISRLKPGSGHSRLAAADQRNGNAADQTDDLLYPNEEEQRAMEAHAKDAGTRAHSTAGAGRSKADRGAPAGGATASRDAAAKPPLGVAPAAEIERNVDAETWTEYGGWYQQDHAIFYRPSGHKDKFIRAWLAFTGPSVSRGDRSLAAAVFDFLTAKDAQGGCTKCHSVDDVQGAGRIVNFSPPSVEAKHGSFTQFVHEPHFGIMDNRGCLSCHKLESNRSSLESYAHGDPKKFASNFGTVKKEVCETCHARGKARQDCLTCHKYHVNGVVTPIMSTRVPTQ